MKGKFPIGVTTLVLSAFLLLLPVIPVEVQAAEKVGWVGPIYKELSDSLMKGFKEYYKKTYNKEIEITFGRPGGWPPRRRAPVPASPAGRSRSS